MLLFNEDRIMFSSGREYCDKFEMSYLSITLFVYEGEETAEIKCTGNLQHNRGFLKCLY